MTHPTWFDPTKHLSTGNAYQDRESGVFLAGDGLPCGGARRAQALAAAGRTDDPLELVPADAVAEFAAKVTAQRQAEKLVRRAEPAQE
jgi:hypothetical protein